MAWPNRRMRDGKHDGVCLVEISKIWEARDSLFLDKLLFKSGDEHE